MKRHLPYKREQVWLVLTNAKLLGKWFMENDFIPSTDHEFTFRCESYTDTYLRMYNSYVGTLGFQWFQACHCKLGFRMGWKKQMKKLNALLEK